MRDKQIEIRDDSWPQTTKQTVMRVSKSNGQPMSGTIQLAFKEVLFPRKFLPGSV